MIASTLFNSISKAWREIRTSIFIAHFVVYPCAFVLIAASPASSANEDTQLEALLDASGTIAQVKDWPGVTKAGFEQGLRESGRIPDAVIDQMLASADRHLNPETILRAVREAVGAQLNERNKAFLLEWYNSDTGRLITEAEKASSTAQAYERFVLQIPMLLQNRPRAASARRIEKLVSATDMAMEMQSYAGIALYSAMMTAMAPEQPLDLESYRETSNAMRPEVRRNTQQFVIASIIYSYLNVDEQSLLEYETFLAHPTTRRFNMRAFEGLSQGTQEVMTNWSHDIANILRNHLAQRSANAVEESR